MYKVILNKQARVFYTKANKSLAKKLARCFEVLERSPRHNPNITSLRGNFKGLYRYRVGDYRVIYNINDQEITVIVIAIAPRSKIYE